MSWIRSNDHMHTTHSSFDFLVQVTWYCWFSCLFQIGLTVMLFVVCLWLVKNKYFRAIHVPKVWWKNFKITSIIVPCVSFLIASTCSCFTNARMDIWMQMKRTDRSKTPFTSCGNRDDCFATTREKSNTRKIQHDMSHVQMTWGNVVAHCLNVFHSIQIVRLAHVRFIWIRKIRKWLHRSVMFQIVVWFRVAIQQGQHHPQTFLMLFRFFGWIQNNLKRNTIILDWLIPIQSNRFFVLDRTCFPSILKFHRNVLKT